MWPTPVSAHALGVENTCGPHLRPRTRSGCYCMSVKSTPCPPKQREFCSLSLTKACDAGQRTNFSEDISLSGRGSVVQQFLGCRRAQVQFLQLGLGRGAEINFKETFCVCILSECQVPDPVWRAAVVVLKQGRIES